MKRFGLFVLLAASCIHAQTTLEKCGAGSCYGFGPPTGQAANGYIYQDVSQTIPGLFCAKNGAWMPCGGTSTPVTPGGVAQQIQFNNGTFGGSKATADAPGNLNVLSIGGTQHATINQTTPTSNDGILNALTPLNATAIADSSYPTTEAPAFGTLRPQIFATGFFNTMAPVPYGYNTRLMDRRAGSRGTFDYNPNSVNPFDYFLLRKDDNQAGQTGSSSYAPYVMGGYLACCGTPQQGNDQSNFQMFSHNFNDFTSQIAGYTSLVSLKTGTADWHSQQNIHHANGGCVNGSDECATIHRDAIMGDALPFWGTVTALSAGTTTIPVTKGSSSLPPGEGKLLVNVSQFGTPFHIISGTGGTFPTPGTALTDTTFPADTSCTVATTVPVTSKIKGLKTSASVSLTGCTAAITTATPVCIAGLTRVQQVQVLAAGALSSGNQTVTLNLDSAADATALVMQGQNTCSAMELLANQVPTGSQPYRQLVRVIGRSTSDPATLLYVSFAAGNWTTAYTGKFSFQGIGPTTLTRDGTGHVGVNIGSEFANVFANACILITSAADPSFNGTFCGIVETGSFPAIITWSNPGPAASTTTSTNNYFTPTSAGGTVAANAAQIAPAAMVLQAENPSTRVADGTVVVEYNGITFAAGNTVASSASANNLMQMHHEQITEVGATSSSIAGGATSLEWDNPSDGSSIWDINVIGNVGDYTGAGGQRIPSLHLIKATHGQPLYNGYFQLHAPANDDNDGVITIKDCGLRACTDSAAFYNVFNLSGSSGGILKQQWRMSTNDWRTAVTLGGAFTQVDVLPTLYRVTTNDGAGNATQFSITPTAATINSKLICLADGTNCPAGSGGISGQTAGFAVEAATGTTATGPFPLDDSITTAATITAHKKFAVASGGSDPSQVVLGQVGNAPTVVANAFSIAAPASVPTGNTVVGFTAPCSGVWTLTNVAGVMTSTCGTSSGSLVNITGSVTVSGCTVSGSQCVVGSATPNVTFSAIPGGFTSLKIVSTVNSTDASGTSVATQFNGDTATHYIWQQLFSFGATVTGAGSGALVDHADIGPLPGSTSGSSPATFDLIIPNYSGTAFNKTTMANGSRWGTATSELIQNYSGRWESTAAITSIKMFSEAGGNFVVGSTFSIYGVQ